MLLSSSWLDSTSQFNPALASSLLSLALSVSACRGRTHLFSGQRDSRANSCRRSLLPSALAAYCAAFCGLFPICRPHLTQERGAIFVLVGLGYSGKLILTSCWGD